MWLRLQSKSLKYAKCAYAVLIFAKFVKNTVAFGAQGAVGLLVDEYVFGLRKVERAVFKIVIRLALKRNGSQPVFAEENGDYAGYCADKHTRQNICRVNRQVFAYFERTLLSEYGNGKRENQRRQSENDGCFFHFNFLPFK